MMAEEAVKLVLFVILIRVIDARACILGLEATVRGHKLRCGESTVSVWILVFRAALLLVTVQLLASWVSGDLDSQKPFEIGNSRGVASPSLGMAELP